MKARLATGVVIFFVLCSVAQAAIIGSQTDSSTLLRFEADSLADPSFALPAGIAGTLKGFDMYVEFTACNKNTGECGHSNTDVENIFNNMFFGLSCTLSSGDNEGVFYKADYSGVVFSDSATTTAPALVHFTWVPSSALGRFNYSPLGSAGYPVITSCSGGLDAGFNLRSASDGTPFYATFVTLGSASGVPYFVGYDTLGAVPAVSHVSIVSTNASTTLAKTGNTAILTFTADTPDGPMQTPVVTLGTHTASVATSSVSGTTVTYQASSTLDSSDSAGALTFSIVAKNTYGELGFNTSTTSDGTSVTLDKTAPVLAEVAPIATSTNTAPSYSFTTTEAGTITYGGSCSSATTAAGVPTTTVAFNALAVGTYSNCTIAVTDAAGNASAALAVTPFEIDAPPAAPPAPAPSGRGGNGPPVANLSTLAIPSVPAPVPTPTSAPALAPAPISTPAPAKSSGAGYSDLHAGKSPEVASPSLGKPPAPDTLPTPVPTAPSQAAAVVTAPVPKRPLSPWFLITLPVAGGLWWGGRKFLGYTIKQ